MRKYQKGLAKVEAKRMSMADTTGQVKKTLGGSDRQEPGP